MSEEKVEYQAFRRAEPGSESNRIIGKNMKLIDKLVLVAVTIVLALGYATNSMAQTQARGDGHQPSPAEQRPSSARDRFVPAILSGPASTDDHAAGEPKTTPGSNATLQSAVTDQWHFQFSPYLWIAGISGRAGIGPLTVNVDSRLTDPNVHLNFGFMGTFEARKNKLVILTDLQYSNLGTERPNPGVLFSSATADFKTFIFDSEVGYRVADHSEAGHSLDLLGGIRYWHLRTDMNFEAGVLSARSVTGSRGWVDAVAGLRGRLHLSPKIFLVGKGDLGGGGSKLTYQLFGGFGYQAAKRVALVAGYRDIHVNYDRDNFLFDASLNGPILGVVIRLGK